MHQYAAEDYETYLDDIIGPTDGLVSEEEQIEAQIVLLEKTADKIPAEDTEARERIEWELQTLRKTPASASNWVWVISLITLLATVVFSRYLKGFLGQLPLLLGALTDAPRRLSFS